MAALWMLVSGLCFAASSAFAKLAAAQSFGPAELVLYRSLLIVVAIALFARLAGLRLATAHWQAHFTRSAAGVVSILMFFWCLAHAPLATAVTLNYTAPLFLALITGLLLRERIARLSGAAIIIGFIGVAALLQPWSAATPLLPGLVGLAAGAVAAIAYLGIRRLGAIGEPEWRTVFYFALLGLLAGLLALPFTGINPVRTQHLPLLVGIGAFALASQLAMTLAYSRGPTLAAGTLSYSGVLFAGLFDLLAWQVSPGLGGWLGMALIVAAGAMTVVARRTSTVPAAPAGATLERVPDRPSRPIETAGTAGTPPAAAACRHRRRRPH